MLFTPSDLIAQPENYPGYISVVFNVKTELVAPTIVNWST